MEEEDQQKQKMGLLQHGVLASSDRRELGLKPRSGQRSVKLMIKDNRRKRLQNLMAVKSVQKNRITPSVLSLESASISI